mmetsp:Transcript_17212/g.42546  ORF Transcript_17212/g.42546 Transcript_17212/m.42546 type:complete len:250 (-) Transcript_17212:165-914(-)|eukprot:CAMPEP_0181382116 /NCGR_PEP_ID=MMETSP1106-20121128/20541_1 /TAXON_ID=81844 /ORGANISM="Mantoniella antarctica, Strain SL-175" /LENGTH=249 /DNA_ID=CAMNT_0023501461 /DNA_START=130 /DNA_END=882 /DNA_ORIENTATION=+
MGTEVDARSEWGADTTQLWKTNDQMADKQGERSTVYWVGGMQYKGEWARNMMNGKGTLTYASGDKYEGEWLDNKRHGFGTLWKHESGKFRVEYNGTWVGGKKQGFGVFYSAAGDRYEGEWAASKRHGKGRQTFGADPRARGAAGGGADVYQGDWVAGNRCGGGTMQYANGDAFQGGWDRDDKHGEGTYFYEATQTRYDGVWEAGTPRCGSYCATDPAATPKVALPALRLLNAEEVSERAARLAIQRVEG